MNGMDNQNKAGERLSRERRVISPLRVEKLYVCATDQKVRSALESLRNNLPLTDVQFLNNPAQMAQKSSEGFSVLMVDDVGAQFLDAASFRKNNPLGRIILLSKNIFIGGAPPSEAELNYAYTSKADHVFFTGYERYDIGAVLFAAARCAKDKMNIEMGVRAKRFIYLVVDDEPRWHSEFLPVLYRIIGQRAAVLTARTYEEANGVVMQHADDIVCLISDIFIPRGDNQGPHGKNLVETVKRNYPRIPIIVASKAGQAEELRQIAFIMMKGDEGALAELERYLKDFTGLGDFLFYDGGKSIGRASTLFELRDQIGKMPATVLENYAEKDYFSTWAYMHAYRRAGDMLRPRHDKGEMLRQMLISVFDAEVENVRKEPLRLIDEKGVVVAEVMSLKSLVESLKTLDVEMLEFYSEKDGFSTWLMRKGYSELADELRPVCGKGEELRAKLIGIVGKWMADDPAEQR